MKKYQKKREISKYRKHTKPLKNWQIDVKYLSDIPNLFLLYTKREIPKYEYTARNVKQAQLLYVMLMRIQL